MDHRLLGAVEAIKSVNSAMSARSRSVTRTKTGRRTRPVVQGFTVPDVNLDALEISSSYLTPYEQFAIKIGILYKTLRDIRQYRPLPLTIVKHGYSELRIETFVSDGLIATCTFCNATFNDYTKLASHITSSIHVAEIRAYVSEIYSNFKTIVSKDVYTILNMPTTSRCASNKLKTYQDELYRFVCLAWISAREFMLGTTVDPNAIN